MVRVADCTIRGRADDTTYRAALSFGNGCTHAMACNNFLGRGSEGEFAMPQGTGTAVNNVMV
jgi:hypothetical protein